MLDKKTRKSNENNRKASIKSDALFKSIMSEEVAAREFLTEYLPEGFKDLVDLSQIKIEKESYIEEDLKLKFSDIIYRIRRKDGDDAFSYILLEHQSKPDPIIAFRLWKYALLLCERHIKNKGKLPLVVPMVFYNGIKKYNVAKNLWDLFEEPNMSKQLLCGDYKLIDLQSMSDDAIKKKKHLGMVEYFMKHIHTRDMLKLWEEFMNNFSQILFLEAENRYIYIKKFLWYTDTKVAEESKGILNKLILDNLQEEGEEVMRTIADGYIEEGIAQGIAQGREEGIEQGMQEAIIFTAKKMLLQNINIELISAVTGLSKEKILKL